MAPPKLFINSKKLDIEKQAEIDEENYNGDSAKTFNIGNQPTTRFDEHGADRLKKNNDALTGCEKENTTQEVSCCLSIVTLSCIGLGLALITFAVSSFFNFNCKLKIPSEMEVAPPLKLHTVYTVYTSLTLLALLAMLTLLSLLTLLPPYTLHRLLRLL